MEILDWLAASPVAAALKGSSTLYLLVNAAHILSVGLVVGAILPLDLRILGVLRTGSLPALAPFLWRIAAAGVAAAIVTGLCLFSVNPRVYAANPAFLAKIGLLSLGVANALLLHRTAGWRRMLDGGGATSALRLRAGFSAAVWIAALVAGRWIAFL